MPKNIFTNKIVLIFVGIVFCLGTLLAGLTYKPANAAPHQVITVTTLDDELNSDGDCSLREAIQAANTDTSVDACAAGSGSDVITLKSGLYTLSLGGTEEDANQRGDLDINDDLEIHGMGQEATIINGDSIDRVFHILNNATVEISNLSVKNGSAVSSPLYGGGGIFVQTGSLVLRSCLISNNATNKPGGGIDNMGILSVINSTILENNANTGGGIFNGGTLNITNSTLQNNSAVKRGGGIDNNDTADFINVTVSGNSSPDAGGVFNDGVITFRNVTITDNTSGLQNSGGSVRIKNTIVANSTDGDNCVLDRALTSEGHNLDSGATCGFNLDTDISNEDPKLGPLQDNDGPTLTHALLAGSWAIDKGDDIDCPETDERGAIRPADGDEDGQASCDVGAFEFAAKFPSGVFLPFVRK